MNDKVTADELFSEAMYLLKQASRDEAAISANEWDIRYTALRIKVEELSRPAAAALATGSTEQAAPVPMLLWCPECHERHIDRGDFAHRPHHTHACQNCGMTWRPSIVPTVGVLFLPGFKDRGEP